MSPIGNNLTGQVCAEASRGLRWCGKRSVGLSRVSSLKLSFLFPHLSRIHSLKLSFLFPKTLGYLPGKNPQVSFPSSRSASVFAIRGVTLGELLASSHPWLSAQPRYPRLSSFRSIPIYPGSFQSWNIVWDFNRIVGGFCKLCWYFILRNNLTNNV